jgi:DNA repair/transcription protein MET18/MMS19
VAEWSSKIWDALKFEVWDGTNVEFIERTLKVIQAIGRKLDNGTLDWQNINTSFAQYVISTSTECSRRLHDSKLQHVLGSGQILHAVASSSPFGFYLVVRNVLSKMFLIWDDLTSKDKKIPLLAVFNNVLQARLDLRDAINIAAQNPLHDRNFLQYLQNSETTLAAALAVFQQSIVDDVFINAMMGDDAGEPIVDTPYKVNAIKGLVLGARIPAFLSDYHKGTVILEFSKLAVKQSQSEEIRTELVNALQQISVEDITRYRDVTLTTFMGELPDRLSSKKDDFKEQIDKTLFILEALTQISCTASCKVELAGPPLHSESSLKFRVFEEFQGSLLKKFHGVIQLPGQLQYANAILAAMFRGLQLFDEVLEQEEAGGEVLQSEVPAIGPYTWIIMDLYQNLVQQKPNQDGPLSTLHYMGLKINLDQDAKVNDLFFGLLGRLTTLALRSAQTTPINNFLFNMNKEGLPSQVWYLFCQERPTDLIEISQQNLECGPAEKYLMNVLSMSLVAGIRRDVSFYSKPHFAFAKLSAGQRATEDPYRQRGCIYDQERY